MKRGEGPAGWPPLRPVEGSEARLLWHRYPPTVILAIVVSLGTAAVFLAMAFGPSARSIQRADQDVLSFMLRVRWPPATWLGLVFNVLGAAVVTAPVRIAVGLFLAIRRRWWLLGTLLLIVATSEALSTFTKRAYDRARPPDPLVHTTGASFPSGHAVAAASTAVALVIVLVEPGRRMRWWIGSLVFTLLMALSRAYLRAHWLSDAVAGTLLGAACGLDSVLVVQVVHDRFVLRRRHPRAVEPGPLEESGRDPGLNATDRRPG